LIKLDIINEVVNRTGITKTKAEMAVETVFESMKKALEQGDRIELRGFGVFNVKPRKTGIGRNPRTGAEVSIPPGKAVRFKPGKELQTLQYRRCSRPRTAGSGGSSCPLRNFSPASYPLYAEDGNGKPAPPRCAHARPRIGFIFCCLR
jgi:DNA-binding protein HU-beta